MTGIHIDNYLFHYFLGRSQWTKYIYCSITIKVVSYVIVVLTEREELRYGVTS